MNSIDESNDCFDVLTVVCRIGIFFADQEAFLVKYPKGCSVNIYLQSSPKGEKIN
jgi:hypothetical protein